MKAKLFLVLFSVSSAIAAGQSLGLSYDQHATQNLFQTNSPTSDQISSIALFLSKDAPGLSFLSDFQYSFFHENKDLGFGSVGLGLDFLRPTGARSALYLAAGGTGRFFRSEYTPFGSLSFELVGVYKTYLDQTSIFKIQLLGDFWAYRDSLFDSYSQVSSLSLDKFFPTRTTIKIEGGWKYKRFLHPYLSEAPQDLSGEGSGSALSQEENRGRPRYQGGHGFMPKFDPQGGGAGLQLASLSILVAQGIGSSAGLNVSGTRQWFLSGENPFLSIEEFYLVDNPSSDDFSWEGIAFSSWLTVVFPWDIELKIGYTASDKEFRGIEIMTPEGEPTGILRNDRRYLIEGRLEKSFARLTVYVAFSGTDNRSNDPLFTWKSPAFLGGIEWRLPFGRKE